MNFFHYYNKKQNQLKMPLTIRPAHAYALLSGLYIGKFTNIFSDVVITVLVLYIVTPEIFTEDRLTRFQNWVWSWFQKPTETKSVHIEAIENLMKNRNLLEEDKSTVFGKLKLPRIETLSPLYVKSEEN